MEAGRLRGADEGGQDLHLGTYVVICGLAWTTAWRFWAEQRDQNSLYIGAALLAAALTVFLPWLYRRYQDAVFASVLTDAMLVRLTGSTTLSMTPEGITEIRPPLTVRASWSEITRVRRDGRRVMLVLAPLVAIVVPASAFPDDASWSAFEAMIARQTQAPS